MGGEAQGAEVSAEGDLGTPPCTSAPLAGTDSALASIPHLHCISSNPGPALACLSLLYSYPVLTAGAGSWHLAPASAIAGQVRGVMAVTIITGVQAKPTSQRV